MAGIAKRHVISLVLHQQPRLGRRVWLVACQASDLRFHPGCVARIHYVLHRMAHHRVTNAVFYWQNNDPVLLVIVLLQLDLTVEYRESLLGFQSLGLRVRAVTFQTKRTPLSPKQLWIAPTVGLVTGRTAQSKRGLVQVRLLKLLGLLAVAGKTSGDGIGLQKSRRLSGMWIVAGNAIALRAWMLHFRLFDFLCLLSSGR